jgi:hypothetical protein
MPLISPFSTHKQHILSHFIHNRMVTQNLIPWGDSNAGLLVPEADAMSTALRRHRAREDVSLLLCRHPNYRLSQCRQNG